MNILGDIFLKLITFDFNITHHFKTDNENIQDLNSNDLKNNKNQNNFILDSNDILNNKKTNELFNKEFNKNNEINDSNNSFFKKLYLDFLNKLFINYEYDDSAFKKLKIKENIEDTNKDTKDNQKLLKYQNILNKFFQEFFIKNQKLKNYFPFIILILVVIAILSYFIIGFEIAVAIIIFIFMALFIIFYFPKMQKEKKYSEISKELPYILRHMVTELRSGKGLHDTLNSIAKNDYGVLSDEFSRVLEEIKYGENTETSLISMSKRVSSDGLNRTTQQIIGTIRTGGNLSNSLNIIAEDITHDLQMKLKDYSQKLNAFIMIYTFLAILAPVIFLIMLMASSTVIGDVISPDMIFILYIFFFPMIIMFMGLMIKRLEPKI